MGVDYEAKVCGLSLEKALTVAAYGESVAAYRYRRLCEQAPTDTHRKVFTEMADEEQSHHRQVQLLLKKHFPGIDFVLTPEDKDLVIVGPRTLDVSEPTSFAEALQLITDSERLTGRFYACVAKTTDSAELKPLLNAMAEECVEHAQRLGAIPATD